MKALFFYSLPTGEDLWVPENKKTGFSSVCPVSKQMRFHLWGHFRRRSASSHFLADRLVKDLCLHKVLREQQRLAPSAQREQLSGKWRAGCSVWFLCLRRTRMCFCVLTVFLIAAQRGLFPWSFQIELPSMTLFRLNPLEPKLNKFARTYTCICAHCEVIFSWSILYFYRSSATRSDQSVTTNC